MSRDVTNAFIEACNASQTDECFIILIAITHDTLPVPILINTSGQDVVSNGDTYLFCPVEVTLSNDNDDTPPQAKLVIDNIDRTVVSAVRSIITPPSVTLSLIAASAPDTIEVSFTDFKMKEVSYNELTIEGTLTLEGLFQEPAIGYTFSPTYFPGLF